MFPLANVLQPLIDVFETILKAIHGLGLGWGMAIVALTVLIRALLLPLSIKSIKSMRNMSLLAPEIKRLRDKHKDDPQRLNQEVMKFYRDNKVNPAASCLPLVAQIPVFMALFFMLQDDLRVDICPDKQVGRLENPVPCGASGDSSFLFIPDLTDSPVGSVLIILVVLYVASQLFSMLLSMTTSTVDKTQKYVMLALPFVFVPFILNFPAGLLVYWITTNLWTILQQLIINRTLGPMPPPAGDSAVPGSGRLQPAGAGATAGLVQAAVSPSGPPPPPPRRKKKRSGRRR